MCNSKEAISCKLLFQQLLNFMKFILKLKKINISADFRKKANRLKISANFQIH